MNAYSIAIAVFMCSLPLSQVAVAQQANTSTADQRIRDIELKLDLILRRLDSLGRRLGRMERQHELITLPIDNSNHGQQSETRLLRWQRPREAIPPSVDAGMLLDAVERAHRKKGNSLDLYPQILPLERQWVEIERTPQRQ